MARRNRRWPRLLATLVGIGLLASVAQADEPRAVERFHAAAALQQRSLYDLAADEYAAIITEAPGGTLVDRARLQRGICLFQLGRFDEARSELAGLIEHQPELEAGETEQLHAYFGLANYNLSVAAEGEAREKLLDAAIDALEKQLAQFPEGALAVTSSYFHAEALYARGRLDASVAAYQSLLTRFPQHPQRADSLYALGVAQQESGHFHEASQTLGEFATEFPQHAALADARSRHAESLFLLAQSQLTDGQAVAARQTVERLLAEFPQSSLVPAGLAILAQVQIGEQKWVEAETSLDECLRRSTTPEVATEARWLRARVRFERGEFAGSLADAAAVLKVDPQRAEVAHLVGRCEAALGRPAEAAKTFSGIIEREPNYAAIDHVLYDLAWAYQESNESERALSTYARLIASHPASPLLAECHYRLGEARFAAGDFSAAATSFQAASECAKDASLREKAIHKLGWSRFEQQDFAAAQTAFERQVAEYATGEHAAEARSMVAECRYERHDYEAALPALVRAFDDRAASELLRAMAVVHAAEAAAKLGEWQQSFDLAERSLEEFPKNKWSAEAHCLRGTALYQLGRLDEAERELKVVAADNQGLLNLRAEFVLGKIHVARQQFDDGVRAFFKVAYSHGGKSAPASYHHWQAEAIYAAASALEETKRLDAASKLYQELLKDYPESERAAVARQSLERIMRR